MVKGEAIADVLETAAKTIESITVEAYKSDDEEGKPMIKTRRRAKLKTLKEVNKTKKQEEQGRFCTEFTRR